jgi:hypothetical protein
MLRHATGLYSPAVFLSGKGIPRRVREIKKILLIGTWAAVKERLVLQMTLRTTEGSYADAPIHEI